MKEKATFLNEEKTDRFIRQKVREAADRYEQELNRDPALEGVKPSPELFDKIMEQIKREEAAPEGEPEEKEPAGSLLDFLSQEDRAALELGRKQMKKRGPRKIWRHFGIAAAVLVGILGLSMTSEANRVRLVDMWNTMVGKEVVVRLEGSEENQLAKEDEKAAWSEIEEKLGIVPMELVYYPTELVFDNYTIEKTVGRACMFYRCKDTILTVYMVKKEKDSSNGVMADGEVLDTYKVKSMTGEFEISEIEAPEGRNYSGEIFYQDCYYTIYGSFPKDKFDKIIENIIFW